jgi:SAM-dependent methyltransferase
MKPQLLHVIACPHCRCELVKQNGSLVCLACGRNITLQRDAPIFTTPPTDMRPSEKLPRGPNIGTPWRQANWRFLAEQVRKLDNKALILDVGAGRGDFADLFANQPNYLALDIYPYPEVDIVCDLTQVNPFRPGSLDAIVLMNVLEHVYDSRLMLASLSEMLVSGGILIVAVPFMVKIHQAPVDFCRYTHFTLQRLGEDHGLVVEHLEGFYDPVSLLGEGIGNLKNAVLPEVRGAPHYAGRVIAWGLAGLANSLRTVLGPGQTLPPSQARSLAPTGYQIVYRKMVG